MQITAQMVKELREKTGVGMMKCKEALKETDGDIQKAIDFLRKKGLASASKRSGRATSEGLVFPLTSKDRRIATIVEINCETDFVARNDDFTAFTKEIAQTIISNPAIKDVETLQSASINGKNIDEHRKEMIAKIGENITFGRIERFEIPQNSFGLFDTYIHGEGNIASLVHVSCDSKETETHAETLNFAHEVALQAAAMKPLFTTREEVPTETLTREKEVIEGQIKNDPKNSSKPAEIVNKIVEGRLAKYYKENCLVEQSYIKDDSKTIAKLAEEFSGKAQGKINVVTFRRWSTGESTEQQPAQENSSEASG